MCFFDFIFNVQDQKSLENETNIIQARKFDPNDEFAYSFDITTIKDRMIRICCVNYHLHKQKVCANQTLFNYLNKQTDHPQLFLDITPQNLKDHSDSKLNPGFIDLSIKQLKDNFNSQKNDIKTTKWKLNDPNYIPKSWEVLSKWRLALQYYTLFCTYVFFGFVLPLFIVTRIFYLIFPIIAIIEEFKYYTNQSNKSVISFGLIGDIIDNNAIVLFQVVLFIMYYILVIIWIGYFFHLLNFYFWVKLIGLEGSEYFGIWNAKKIVTMNAIIQQYNQMYGDLIIEGILCDIFGNDIASVIFNYYLAVVF